MRGDSARDLYAKVMALAGLGMLGALGAVVDYWPAGRETTPAGSFETRVAASIGHPADLDLPAITLTASSPAVARRVKHVRRPAASVEPANAVVEVVSADDVPVTEMKTEPPSATASAPVPEPFAVTPLSTDFLAAYAVSLSILDLDVMELPPSAEPMMRAAAVGPPPEKFLSGAARRTGEALDWLGQTTVGAFKAVGGAVGNFFSDVIHRVAGGRNDSRSHFGY